MKLSQIMAIVMKFYMVPRTSGCFDTQNNDKDIVKEILLRCPVKSLLCDSNVPTRTENSQMFLGMKYLIGYVDGLFLMYGEINSVISCALWNSAIREQQSIPVVGTYGEFSKIEGFDKPPPFDKEVRHTYGTAYLNVAYY
ncbi:hypothetical protein H5410_024590 [Solanum commersonii]|uniref:Uncharacterized protein n=1 Tax=Solanum commersonii TaxID=4109 RepID=A0A9J5ZMC8_SOLCO|nr:hypothetical protein H5410_024590 [Solanum commersonii]